MDSGAFRQPVVRGGDAIDRLAVRRIPFSVASFQAVVEEVDDSAGHFLRHGKCHPVFSAWDDLQDGVRQGRLKPLAMGGWKMLVMLSPQDQRWRVD